MRLSGDEIQHIITETSNYLKKPFELRLYGSRLDDSAQGGDIDLLLIVDEAMVKKAKWDKHILLVSIKEKIGEQKIDLTICCQESIQSNNFLKMIYPASIKIS